MTTTTTEKKFLREEMPKRLTRTSVRRSWSIVAALLLLAIVYVGSDGPLGEGIGGGVDAKGGRRLFNIVFGVLFSLRLQNCFSLRLVINDRNETRVALS